MKNISFKHIFLYYKMYHLQVEKTNNKMKLKKNNFGLEFYINLKFKY